VLKEGTNHQGLRERLLALASNLGSDAESVKEREFQIGYDLERLNVLLGLYSAKSDDLPAIGANVLAELSLLSKRCGDGLSHLSEWAQFMEEAKLMRAKKAVRTRAPSQYT